MVTVEFTRVEISALCDRLSARATSRLWTAEPEHRRDLIAAVAVMRGATDIGFPIRPIEVELPGNGEPK